MKYYIILILVLFVSCIGPEYTGPPNSSELAKENGVLLNRYIPNKERVRINNKDYYIVDSWTSYNLPERYSKKVNKKMYNFFIVLKDAKTDLLSTDNSFDLPRKYIKYNGIEYGYAIGLSDLSGMLAIDYLSKKKPIAEDTLSFTLTNDAGKETLLFYKENSASH